MKIPFIVTGINLHSGREVKVDLEQKGDGLDPAKAAFVVRADDLTFVRIGDTFYLTDELRVGRDDE